MHVPLRQLRQQEVARHHDRLAGRGNALQPHPGRDRALVHHAVLEQVGVLTVLRHRDPERARILERTPHDLGGDDRVPIIADRHGAGVHHLTELRELLALLPQRGGPDGVDAGRAGVRPLLHDEPDGRLVVGHRVGVGHRAHRCEATRRSRPGSRRHRLRILAPRLAQMDVDVHEAGRHDLALAVDDLRPVGRRELFLERLDLAVHYEEIRHGIVVLRGIHDPPALQEHRLHSSTSRPLPLAASASSGLPPASR